LTLEPGMRLEYFQLIDRVIALDIAVRTIRVEAVVPESSTIFEGHFPGHPLMPGVLLVEAMAQTCGWLIIGVTAFDRMPFLAAVKEAKLRRFVIPGERLLLGASLSHEGSGYAMAEAFIEVDGKRVCDAGLTFRLMPFPSDAFRTTMREWAQSIEFPQQAAAHG
jgi:3-hydroxyacyl-[acyl-carrier-protein] dehydratase